MGERRKWVGFKSISLYFLELLPSLIFLPFYHFTILPFYHFTSMIKALIFDMDGVLLDSEPFWRTSLRAELASLGTQLSEQEAADTMGIRIDKVLEYRQETHGWSGKPIAEAVDSILDRVIKEVKESAVLLPGVWEVIEKARKSGLKIGLATSSPSRLITAVIEALGLGEVFEVLCSAEMEEYGKPHPAIYITTAKKLGVAPQECLAIEDSFNGLLSAKAAQMKCIVVPEEIAANEPGFVIADLRLNSLLDLEEERWETLLRWE